MRRVRLLALLPWLSLLCAVPAGAHVTGTSYLVAEPAASGSDVTLQWDIALEELRWNVLLDRDGDGLVAASELEAARGDLAAALPRQLAVKRGGRACVVEYLGASPRVRDAHEMISLALVARCTSPGRLTIGGPLYLLGPTQSVLLEVRRGDESAHTVLNVAVPRWQEREAASAWMEFGRFLVEGVWHVAIGYDHVAFILLLLLPSVLRSAGGKWLGADNFPQVARDLVTIVTAFTVAHSATLALAATDTVTLPVQPVEVAIALSISAAAAINLLPGLARLRLPLAFGFGLVHGFGFANVLAEIDAQGSALAPLLAGFNIGVELAQLAIVAVVLPLIYIARRKHWYAAGVVPLGSCALGAAGLVWLVQRL